MNDKDQMEKQAIEEMAKAKKCNVCIHNAVCEKLEEFRDPLGWVNTENEFCCSYYHKSTEVVKKIFAEIETSLLIADFKGGDVYYAIRAEDYQHYKKKYESEEV